MSEPAKPEAAVAPAAAAPARPLNARNLTVLAAVAAVVLGTILAWLYLKTQGVDFKRQSEILAAMRELKEIDARWDVDILRTRTELAPSPMPGVDYSADIARIRQQLVTASQDEELNSQVLKRSATDLTNAFTQKNDLVGKFRKANGATKQALATVFASDTEIAGLVRGAWKEFRERERLVALENLVTLLLAEAQKYYYNASDAQRKSLESLASELRDSATPFPAALREGITRLDGNIQQVLGAKPVEEEIFAKVTFLTAGPRVASVTDAFSRELENALGERELYRVYLIAFAGALVILMGHLASRLLGSYQELNAANEELERRVVERTRELSEALHQLKESEAQLIQTEKMSSLGQMVAGVAHEINTPLAYVKNSLGSVQGRLPELTQIVAETDQLVALLKSGGGDPNALAQQFAKVQGMIAQLGEQQVVSELTSLVKDGLYGIEQISEIVVNLKNFSRLDRSKVASFSVNEGLDSTLLLAKHDLRGHTIQKKYGDVPAISCSPSQINQVLLNLINNAAQAIEAGQGTITLTTRREGDQHVAVEVEDNGKGIPPDVLPKIFDPFFTTKDVGKGTGLGLSICYKIVEQHGGRITVDSAVGIGTKFKVVLPLTPPPGAELAA